MLTQEDLRVSTVGPPRYRSPLGLSTLPDDHIPDYVSDNARVALTVETNHEGPLETLFFEKAGPRERIALEPSAVRAGIVTCGGLCPGLNHVVRSLVFELHHKYGVRHVLGYRYGFAGLGPGREPPMPLEPGIVRHIHRLGGSLLGLSRGQQAPAAMLQTLAQDGVNVLFTIGGDGTLRGAHALALEAERQGQALSVVGIPKTVDNDVPWVDKTFGFDTAVELACIAVDGAHTEALSALRGVGIVKLMGRDAGFISAAAAIASGEANFCLVPEVPFDLDGPHGLLAAMEHRLRTHSHALLVVAEGCAARVFDASRGALDASGNVRYASDTLDIGPFLRDRLQAHLSAAGLAPTIKYIDPSYMIRSVPANASDGIFCDTLARNAVHAAMAGRTDVVVGRWHRVFTHLPLTVATATRKAIDPDGALWLAVTEMTGQPPLVPRQPGHRRSTRPPLSSQ